ncbi:DedA family protein [Cryptosporangium sp. NPDC048952]|uniref:DedA family protein n=1 Tax=Cryptosporangium sp. NPDC048952 TaxID=3363961 RepID=UPI003723CB5F
MLEQALELAGSPWIYVVVALVVMADGVFTALPSDSLLICLSALSVSGEPGVLGLIAGGAAGAIAGDFLSYGLGRRAVGRFGVPRRGTAGVAFAAARQAIVRRGGVAIVVGHFLPGGRTATTLAAGWMRMPVRRFGTASAVAGVLWALYISGLGRLGGLAFADRPFLGAIPGIVFGAATGVYLRVRSRRSSQVLDGEQPLRWRSARRATW